jgi:hypothetical protein
MPEFVVCSHYPSKKSWFLRVHLDSRAENGWNPAGVVYEARFKCWTLIRTLGHCEWQEVWFRLPVSEFRYFHSVFRPVWEGGMTRLSTLLFPLIAHVAYGRSVPGPYICFVCTIVTEPPSWSQTTTYLICDGLTLEEERHVQKSGIFWCMRHILICRTLFELTPSNSKPECTRWIPCFFWDSKY